MTSATGPQAIVPFVKDISIDDPAQLLLGLSNRPYLAFLDSASKSVDLGRYSYLAHSPFGLFKTAQGKAFWNDEPLADHPFAALQKILQSFKLLTLPKPMPPFQGGAMGYFSYEAGRLLERLPQTSQETGRIPDIMLPFYDVLLAIDHFAGKDSKSPKAWIISSGLPKCGDARNDYAEERLGWFKATLESAQSAKRTGSTPPAIRNWQSNFSRSRYQAAIEKTIDHIRNGDIFQANITQCFSASMPATLEATPLAYYHQLRKINAAPFSAYLDCGSHIVASSSPERFITLSANGIVETRPIKGTAPRDLANEEKDTALATALTNSEKDRAENVMITDLMRNDLSRVCNPGSIKVPELCKLESYARVHHLVSTVKGELKAGIGAVALLGASFPGGSITGAPKIRSMEIITDLENLPREIYCGSIGFIGFNGAMDTNIAIRTLLFKEDRVQFSAGGGITILSDSAEEYEESLHKASAIFRALGTSVEDERAQLEKGSRTSSTRITP